MSGFSSYKDISEAIDILSGKSKKFLKENDSIQVGGMELNNEENEFAKAVTARYQFNSFMVYPKDNNVVLSGQLTEYPELFFTYSLDSSDGVYVNSGSPIQITEKFLQTIQKLRAYYADTWSVKWGNPETISQYKTI